MVPAVWPVPPHVPAPLQSALVVHALPLMLQVPPMMAQSLTDVQVLPEMLQLPVAGQSDCCMQLLPVRLQAPG